MHKSIRKRQCLVCFQDCDESTQLYFLIHHPCICIKCFDAFDLIDQTVYISNYPVRILYHYNEFIRKMIFQYKALDDYALKDVFLLHYPELKKQYKHYIVVVVPSSKEDNARRGFCPNEGIVETFSQRIFTGIYKTQKYKQTSQKDRSGIKHILDIENGRELYQQNVLIFDDVMTSSNTIQATISLVEACHPKKIEVLVLSTPNIRRFLS